MSEQTTIESAQTAWAQTEAERQEQANRRVFECMTEAFFKRWAPHDRYEAAQFHAELAMLTRQIYTDAQAPVFKQLETMLRALPLSPALFAVPAKNDR